MKIEKAVKHNAKVKVFPDGKLHITCFTRDIFTEEGWEYIYEDDEKAQKESALQNSQNDKNEYDTSAPRADSMKRAKAKIFDIALSNEWDYMITLTLDKQKIDRYDPKEIIGPFKNWLNNMVKRHGFKYLIVPELHDDGAIHFHGLINGSLDLTDSGTVKVPGHKEPIKISTAKRYGYDISSDEVRTVYNIGSYKLGYSTAVRIDKNVEAVSKYMTKYTCKNFQKIFGKSFFAGGGVNRNLPTYYLDIPYSRVECEEYRLPENLGAVKYLLLDEHVFKLLQNEWSLYNG